MTALATSPGSRTSASSTSHAPAGKALARSVAARMARRVLPTPPGPTRLTIRTVASFLRSSASSRLRPTKLVASAGRLPGRRTGLAIGAAEITTRRGDGSPENSRGGLFGRWRWPLRRLRRHLPINGEENYMAPPAASPPPPREWGGELHGP